MEKIVFHVDVNNAFLSWSAIEMLKNGSKIDIRKIPSVVGGDEAKRRGVVVAKSTSAKKAGVVTGEALYTARKKVNDLFIVPSDMEKYKTYSEKLYTYLCNFSPSIEKYSIDECFLDMTGTEKIFGDPVSLAYKMKDEIKKTLGFTVNIGIGNCKLCAKMASDFEKPDKVHTLFKDEIIKKMWPLSVDELFMVGKKSAVKLHEMGIDTIENLANTDLNILIRHFKSQGKMMHEYANGIDESTVEKQVAKNKGLSHSTTLPHDTININEIKEVLHILSNMIGTRLREEKMYTTVISLQLKNNEFFSYQHQKKLVNPVSSNEDIYEASVELLKSMWQKDPIRLVGLRVSDFIDKPYEQISLFETPGVIENRDKIQKTLDEINKKYGDKTIVNANLINKSL
ncbi:MAG: DNA polymerase IV [Bacilli bacterium]